MKHVKSISARTRQVLKACTLAGLLLWGCSALLSQTPAQDLRIVIDPQAQGKVFDGLGALSAGASSRLLIDYPEPQRSQILDYLFKPGYGAALQHLKVEVGGDVNSTDGSEPSHMRSPKDRDYTRGYEWWLMREAYKRNPGIILDVLPWGAPGWVGKDSLYTPAMAEYIADFIEGAKKTYGLNIRYAGIWNEKDYDAGYVKELRRALLRHHLDTKIVCCDEYVGEGKGQWAVADDIKKDAELREAVAVIGVHYPLNNDRITTTDSARASGLPLWSSEDQPNSGSGPFLQRDWDEGGKVLAHLYNRNYLEGGMTKTEIWSSITSYYDILAAPNSGLMYANTPWSGHYTVQSTIWVTAHTTQFAQPGWHYADSASGKLAGKGSFVTLLARDLKDWSMVLETIGAERRQKVEIALMEGFSGQRVYVWQTNSRITFEKVAEIEPKQGSFSFEFEPDSLYSLTTTTGQGRGTATPPAAAAFPFPYREDFEGVELIRPPRYLADQDGAFEVHPCSGRPGKCLEQVIDQKPIPWGPLPDPFTLAGDIAWRDYQVEADVKLETGAAAAIMGRIDSADVFQDGDLRWPSGYVLRLHPDGHWELLSARYKRPILELASGALSLDAHAWHRLRLSFRGNRIEAFADGVSLASISDTSHNYGMIALGSQWDHVQFDNLVVTGPNF
jgi:O-glycosyl hydrolase